ncbi:FAD-dependent monooxygenase [Saccharothrix obliqua]|uniref:FAD-dependent monooxygenase n=1 Tax=Saccharothrix obliqua TaxID=2861747 RepID=UPI001C5EF339|nr:FAD-dependent monooxygenase [Saccharothrix obliqua]MBW4721483.1 FAD-dependent monooxygenase [Saccharothrix obliqua]
MRELSIAVVGGGIAGLATAAALHRVGLRCDVFEQTRHLREIGAGVQLAPQAVRVLRRLGVGSHLDKVSVHPRMVEMRRWDDNAAISRTTLGEECAELYGAPYLTLHRADLHRGLLEAVPEGTVHLGARCVSVTEHADAVELRFADGTTRTADVVVGADGIHSAVREVLVADEPRFSGQVIYRGLIPSGRLPFLVAEPKVVLWLGPGQHAVCYPVSRGASISVGFTVPAASGEVESWSAKGDPADVVAAYAEWNEEVRAIAGAADEVGQWALHDRDPITRWSTDRVTVVGDAAHPMLPFLAQGANQAVEDAVALAACLGATTDPAAALRRYETARRERTALIQTRSRANTRVLHLADGEEQRERDLALRARANLHGQAWLYGYDVERELPPV